MNPSKILSLCGILAATGLGIATMASAQTSNCPAGNSGSTDYCSANNNADDPAPATPPAVQPPESGQAPKVAGTLDGGTQTVEVTSSSNEPGTTDVQVNLAGAGTLIVKAGDQTITITVAGDGTTTIDPGDGGLPIVVGGKAGAPGTIEIKVTPEGTTYSLKAPGTKTVTVGNATATIPGTATITRTNGATTYDLNGSGDCTASLDPAVSSRFNSDSGIACVIDESNVSSRALKRFGSRAAWDIIRTGNRADRIKAGPGIDLVHAGGGADRISGGSNRDSLYCDAGNDIIRGDGSADNLYGGSGNDTIYGGDGRDYIDGGSGNDVIYIHGHGFDTVNCGPGYDVVHAGPLDRIFTNCEKIIPPRP